MQTVSFFTNEANSLEREPDFCGELSVTKLEDIDCRYEIPRCADWIKSNNFKKVCLQFPDNMLPDSDKVCLRLHEHVENTIYVSADSTYESCCIDYITAAHVNADAIIHFGSDCYSKTSGNLPYLNVYEKSHLNMDSFKEILPEVIGVNRFIFVIDTNYFHQFEDISQALEEYSNVKIHRIDASFDIKDENILFIGSNLKKLRNLGFILHDKEIFYYTNNQIIKFSTDTRMLKKRNFLIEKIKDSKTIGIIIGTLSVKNYPKIIDRLKKLIELNSKKYYLISVGKPTVAKLANFPELDVYVAVTCAMSEIYESRDFYKPIVSPYDVEIALNANYDKNIKFSLDYNSFLKESDVLMGRNSEETDISLISNTIRSFQTEGIPEHSNQIALKPDGTVATDSNFGMGYLSSRSWQGLEQKLGQNEPQLAEEGQTGIAQKYDHENKT